MLLEAEDLWVHYGAVAALQGVSFRLRAGEFLMILGRNGAGKSTLLKALCGQVPLKAGRILFEGQRIDHLPAWRRTKLGLSLVPEGRRVFAPLSVRENLELGAFVHRQNLKKRLEEVLALFPELVPKLDLPAGALSGGEQQMLAVARALMSNPRMLLLDEPSMGLAPKVVARIYQTLAELKGKMTLLVVEQNLSQGLSLADRLLFLDSGRLVREFTGEDFSLTQVEELYLGAR